MLVTALPFYLKNKNKNHMQFIIMITLNFKSRLLHDSIASVAIPSLSEAQLYHVFNMLFWVVWFLHCAILSKWKLLWLRLNQSYSCGTRNEWYIRKSCFFFCNHFGAAVKDKNSVYKCEQIKKRQFENLIKKIWSSV